MQKYNPKKIESKWRKKWKKSGIYKTKDFSEKPKFYALDFFPYPSGAGLHVGHPKGYIATDVVSRLKILQGYNVLHPMGWDAFGLPAENYAIKNKIHPRISTEKNIRVFRKQLEKFGFTYDWSREISSIDPEFYKWTQWIFLKMFERELAYQSDESVNWCPSCKTVLANEDLENGFCERCGAKVVQKKMKQWVLKMTAYADRLLYDLDTEKLDWENLIVEQQKNWIGRSEGAMVKFQITNDKFQTNSKLQNPNFNEFIEVFTTRLDTIFGCTYLVVAPEHPLITNHESRITNYGEVEKYIIAAQNKTEMERTALAKEKTGVELKGIKAINPFTGEEIPIWVADYVLGFYGTGAVMAVPAHDERDFEFAKKYGLPIKQSVMQVIGEPHNNEASRNVIAAIVCRKSDGKFLLIKSKKANWISPIVGGIEDSETSEKAAEREIYEETGYKISLAERFGGIIEAHFFSDHYNVWRVAYKHPVYCEIENEISDSVSQKEKDLQEFFWVSAEEVLQKITHKDNKQLFEFYLKGNYAFTEDGKLINSGKYTGLTSAKAREEMVKWLEEQGIGKRKVNYKMRDWVFSRQRYWGEPFPLVFCEHCKKLVEKFVNEKISSLPQPASRSAGNLSLQKRENTQGFSLKKEKINQCSPFEKGGQGDFSAGELLNPGWIAVSEKDLPVKLPEVKSYEPTGTGESPLAKIAKWVNVKCPKCGGAARRETNTMPQWAGSSWYYLRYIDPKNKKAPVDKNKEKYWMPVDLYVGGAEHATRHLLYARFWHKFLYDIGAASTKEPFKKLVHVGLVNAEDGRKMSKRWGNVVNPDDIIAEFGADSIRLYEMFMGPFSQTVSWSTKSVSGVRRFLERAWQLNDKCQMTNVKSRSNDKIQISNKLERLVHKTIKKVGDDIENFKFNTAISALMILSNEFEKQESLPKEYFEKFIILLSPFAPHIAEELWEKLGNKKSIFKEAWPKYDAGLIKDEVINLVVSVNGKARYKMEAPADITEEEAKKIALASDQIKKYTMGKTIKKVIFVKGRLLNIVV